eukprot:6202377-Pleurochrysis_carterae.AAC.1
MPPGYAILSLEEGQVDEAQPDPSPLDAQLVRELAANAAKESVDTPASARPLAAGWSRRLTRAWRFILLAACA